MKNEKSIHDLYAQLGATIGDIMAHDDCPAVVYNALANLMNSIDCKMPSAEREVAMARGSFVGFLSVLTTVPERKQKAAQA